MYASRMFHSRGIVQSKTSVPVGTSFTSNATCDPISRSVCRTPSPVMLLTDREYSGGESENLVARVRSKELLPIVST